tara:strand:+ start:36 stop:740 length:705 start_codon:yes stop_codon:yes gene_type:complete
MPRPGINDYTFYKIVNINGDVEMCYVGSTANFKQRKINHRYNTSYKKGVKYNSKLYTTIREHGGWEEFKMVEVGYAEQVSFTQARVIEERYRVELKAELNTLKCYCDKKEYYENNKEKVKKKSKEYYEANKEKRAVIDKEYREKNKIKISEYKKDYSDKNKGKLSEYKKDYYMMNKEKIDEHTKEYREINKEKINERRKEKISCECGCVVTKHHLPRHKLTQKHIDFINNISNT